MPVSGSAREIVPRNDLSEKKRQRLIQHILAGSGQRKLGRTDVAGAGIRLL